MINFINKVDFVLSIRFFENEIHMILLAIFVFFVLFFALKFLFKILRNLIDNNDTNIYKIFGKVLKTIKWWFLLVLELYIPLKILNLSIDADFTINIIFGFLLMLQLVLLSSKVITYSFLGLSNNQNEKKDKTAQKTIEMIVNIIVWVIGITIFITNIGVDLTPLVASLGIASVAVAFALQNILKDLFSSLSIIISKPFNVGDFIIVGEGSKDSKGVVKDITLKATYLSNIGGHEIVIPNSRILDTEVINYGKMKHRRKRFSIGVIRETSVIKLEKIPKIIEEAIKKVKDVKYERCYLNELSLYSIDFFISYDILQTDYLDSLKIKEQIILNILKGFEKEGIKIAYPTQTIHHIENQ